MLRNKQAALILIGLAAAVSIHQFYFWGTFFEMEDLPLHHELFIVTLGFSGLLLLALWYYHSRKWRQPT